MSCELRVARGELREANRAAKNDGVTFGVSKNFVANFVEPPRRRLPMQGRQMNEANGERVFQPVFVHGLENPCSVRYDHCLAKLDVIGKWNVQ